MLLNKAEENIKKFIPKILLEEKGMIWVLLTTALLIGLQKVIQGPDYYNNYIIFKTSFFHLYNDQNLYRNYWDEYNDLYLYSPTFALLMIPLVFLPLWLQVILWCCLNVFSVYIAIKLLPFDSAKKRVVVYWFILIELITALQNVQVSPMVASFIILAFVFFERGNLFKAAFFIVLATFIKIYAIAAVILFLMYPRKLKFAGYMTFWCIIFLLAPLLIVSFNQLLFLYHSWFNLTIGIHQSEETGINPNIAIPLSVMGWLKTWFHLNPPAVYVQLAGTALMCLPFARIKYYKNLDFKLFILASILIWAMIFNHIAESASYIVAILGVGIWYVTEKKSVPVNVLLVTVFIFSILSPTSIFPKYLREHYVIPYVLKAVPCIIVWFVIQYRLLFNKFDK